MSGYTHKIILFSKEQYKGDALVIMANGEGHEIDSFREIKYYSEAYKKDEWFDDVISSVVVEKGNWELFYNKVNGYSKNFRRSKDDKVPAAFDKQKESNGFSSIKSMKND